MKEFLQKIKFEYIFATLVLLVLSIALFYFANNEKLTFTIITVLTNVVTGVTSYLYTKYQVEKEQK